MKELIKMNLQGKVSWKEYSKPGNHDHKFGPTVSEYVCQVPVVGLVPGAIIYGGIFAAIGVVKLFHK